MELFENKSLIHNYSIAYCLDSIFTNDQIDYRLYGNLPISIFGIIINLINIIIFSHADMRRSLVNLFLLTISITDLLLLIFNFFFLLFPVIALFSNSFTLQDIYPVILRFVYIFSFINFKKIERKEKSLKKRNCKRIVFKIII
ncbi:unnamed protein product [Brugia timori]|uniref:G_PROTEIN_RECEP_F1_2 domain-containing protein n=1 Tax=Brugia timori TaxID=42155 RepID=A0A0R3R9L6_9BILA|nr:unnamed protein product [Brugia timori]